MNKEMRARSVHPSRHYGYTHHDAHAAVLPRSMRRLACASRPRHGGVQTDADLPGGVESSQHARFSCVVSCHDARSQGAGRGVPGVRAADPRSFRVVRRSRTGRSFHDGVFPRPESSCWARSRVLVSPRASSAPSLRPRASFVVFPSRTVSGPPAPPFIARGRAHGRARAQSRA